MLPLSALERAGSEITNYRGSGMSVMEMSHRSKVFLKIFEETQEKLRRLMQVPDGYRVLLLYPRSGPAEAGSGGQLLLLLRQQHHLRHRVAVCSRDGEGAPGV